MNIFKKKEKKLLNVLLGETTKLSAFMHGIWTGAKGVKWQTLSREARKEIKNEWLCFEMGQIVGWILKIGLAALVLRFSVGPI